MDERHSQTRNENRKNQKAVIFACCIKRNGTKKILGFGTLKGFEWMFSKI
ncbi:hypothetical protein EHS11_12520 [Leptospira ilyithenensis]|uniref:Uncharacterized protein n=1 Tax=Leptospira ilyithenensis TaxID=2484901 RepID=A0A4R9LMD1_9LEPT|nr:hypothetical protein EHS11_12520 [Leptospira ilyithenensis]